MEQTSKAQYQIENNDLHYTINGVIDADRLKHQYNKELREVSKSYKPSGFRSGMVPKALIEKRFGGQLLSDVARQTVDEDIQQLLKSESLRPAKSPTLDIKSAIKLGEKIEYSLAFEAMPNLTSKDLDKLKLTDIVVDFDEKDVAEEKEKLIDTHVDWKILDAKKKITSGMKVKVDFSGSIDGKPFEGSSAEGHSFRLGKKEMLSDFENAIIGAKKGSKIEQAEVHFPSDYYRDELAGSKATFDIEVQEAWMPDRLEEGADLFKKMGSQATTWDEYQKDLDQSLKSKCESTRESLLNKMTVQKLQKHFAKLALPESFEKAYLDGVDEKDEKKRVKAESKAKSDAVLMAVFQALAAYLEIDLTEAEVDRYIAEMMGPYGNAEMIAWFKNDQARLGKIKDALVEKKILNRLVSDYKSETEEMTLSQAEKKLKEFS